MLYDIVTSRALGEPAALSLLDVGTGTGILAVLASLLGVPSITAIDVDATSVEMAKRNIVLNRRENIPVYRSGIEEFATPRRFDIVTANLLYGIIADNIDRLTALVKPGGLMIASGLSTRWEREAEELFAGRGLAVERKSKLEEWLAYVLKAG